MNVPRILIGATGSGSGKTLITCGLLTIFAEEQKKAAAIKCGPDYIDPMFHRTVIGIPSKNLDTFFTGEELTRGLFADFSRDKDIVVMEGVMGLYDGLGGIREEGSAYHLAKVTKTPVILVVNAHGMGRSLIATVRGFLDFDKEHLIRGVLLNQTSGQFYETIKPELERVCKIPVLGFLPKQKQLHLDSRHLGLVMPGENADVREKLKQVAKVLRETVDIPGLMEIAVGAVALAEEKIGLPEIEPAAEDVRIGVARDEAFCFYYEDNLNLLERAGATLIPFSPLRDKKLPKGISGLLLGGGYPELFAKELSENQSMRDMIASEIRAGMPVVAECGGFLYLHQKLSDMEKRKYEMVGVVPGECFYTGKLVRFGYVELQEKSPCYLGEGETILGHEFHYYDSTANGADVRALKPVSGREWDCAHAQRNIWMGFPHLYYYSNPEYVYRFLKKAKEWRGHYNL